jgi:hypothetical protein
VPQIGPEKKPKSALVDNNSPIFHAGAPYACPKKGRKGIRMENPKISTKTAIHSGLSLGELDLKGLRACSFTDLPTSP